jgi:hypothetical protein
MTELDLQETRIDPRRTESFTDLRHDIGTFGPGHLINPQEPSCTDYSFYPHTHRRDIGDPFFVTGQKAYKTIRNASGDPGAEARRAEKTISPFYFLALLSVAGSLAPIKWLKAGMPLKTTALATALIC